jgi:L-arabinonolactonase
MSPLPRLVVDCRATLGEGLQWHDTSQSWIWTDIQGVRLWRHHPASMRTESCVVRDRVGSFAVSRSGRLLLGFSKSLEWADVDWGLGVVAYEPVAAVEPELATTRVNDGRTDRAGHFVFGTMNEASGHAPIGRIYQYSRRHGLRPLAVGTVGIANSICFSPSGTTMYFCDSMARRIMQCAYDAESATVQDIAPLVVLAPGAGLPDGSVVDADGAIWNAQWGGSVVSRYSPQGTLLAESAVPVAHVTCPAFGGPGLTQVWATTARMDVAAERLARQPETGGVFEIDAHGASGIVDTLFDDR